MIASSCASPFAARFVGSIKLAEFQKQRRIVRECLGIACLVLKLTLVKCPQSVSVELFGLQELTLRLLDAREIKKRAGIVHTGFANHFGEQIAGLDYGLGRLLVATERLVSDPKLVEGIAQKRVPWAQQFSSDRFASFVALGGRFELLLFLPDHSQVVQLSRIAVDILREFFPKDLDHRLDRLLCLLPLSRGKLLASQIL